MIPGDYHGDEPEQELEDDLLREALEGDYEEDWKCTDE